MPEVPTQTEIIPERQDKKELRERLRVLQKIAERALNVGIHDDLLARVSRVNIEILATQPIETENLVKQAEQRLNRLGLGTIEMLMEPIEMSSIFQVMKEGQEHRKASLYQTVKDKDGKEVTITPEVFNVLNLDFTIGTPPITRRHSATIYDAVFGTTTPKELKELGHVLGIDENDFSEMIYKLKRIVDSSNHYTTDAELQDHLTRAGSFVNLEGGHALAKTIVSGGANRAVELIKRYLFKVADKDAIEEIRCDHPNQQIEYMGQSKQLSRIVKANPTKIFIVRARSIPSACFRSFRWQECLGRVILIDDSSNARKTNSCYVYSLFDEVIGKLDETHVNLSGKQAGTQIGLREVLESFTAEKIREVKTAVEAYASRYENHVSSISYENGENEEKKIIARDYFLTRQLGKFLDVLLKSAQLDEADFKNYAESLKESMEVKWTNYFYRRLKESGYQSYVGNGGGREGLELIGRFRIKELADKAKVYLERHQDEFRRLQENIGDEDSDRQVVENLAKEAAESKEKSRVTRGVMDRVKIRLNYEKDRLIETAAKYLLEKMGLKIEELTKDTSVVPEILAKLDEAIYRAIFHPDEDADPRSPVGRSLEFLGDKVSKYRLQVVQKAYEFAVRLGPKPTRPQYARNVLDKLQSGKIDGRLIMEKIMWSYNNVFSEEDFPPDLKITIDLKENGSPNFRALREWFVRLKIILRSAPHLFQLLCESCTVIVNSPHNPTGRVYKEDDIKALLAVASEFGLTIIDDNSYYKVIRKNEKGERPRIPPIAEIYEEHKHLFPKPVRIITVATATKNQCGAGERLYNIITKDPKAISFLRAERKSSMPHVMSLHLAEQKLDASFEIKKIYKILEEIEGVIVIKKWETIRDCINEFERRLNPQELLQSGIPYEAFNAVMAAYYLLCRLTGRGGTVDDAREVLRTLREKLKYTRIEKGVARDIDSRFDAAEEAIENVSSKLGRKINYIKPEGAFYICVALQGELKPVLPFLKILNRYKGVGFSQVGNEYSVRLSLGGALAGDERSYEFFRQRIETALIILFKYWEMYESSEDVDSFEAEIAADHNNLSELIEEKSVLWENRPRKTEGPFSIDRRENGVIFKIEEDSKAVNIVLEGGACTTVEEFLRSNPFRIIYNFLLRNCYKEIKNLMAMTQEEAVSKFPPELVLRAYKHDPTVAEGEREMLKQILFLLFQKWYGVTIRTHLITTNGDKSNGGEIQREQQIRGASEKIGIHIATLLTAFGNTWQCEKEDEGQKLGHGNPHGFARGYENLGKIESFRNRKNLPSCMADIAFQVPFIGVTATTNPHPSYNTETIKRIAGREVMFEKRGETEEEIAQLRNRLLEYAKNLIDSGEYVCNAVQVGHTRQMLIIHKASLHFLHDKCRLFPEMPELCNSEDLKNTEFDAVLFFGLPAKVMGEHQMTGYFVDQCPNGKYMPIGWVARSNRSDYFGFVKKWLLTLHNEITLQRGAVPIHGALFTIHFRDGAKFTVIAAGDTATGKSELTAKFMEQIDKLGSDSPIESIEFIAPDMMSVHIGEDRETGNRRIYALGTETGDFSRLDDLLNTDWEKKYAHLLYRATRTNIGQENARATIPDICESEAVLTPQEVDGIFYFNNFAVPRSHFTELSVGETFGEIALGRRKVKATSEDLPHFDACVLFSDRSDLVKRYGMQFSDYLTWEKDKKGVYCVAYKDGRGSYTKALEYTRAMFIGKELKEDESSKGVKVVDVSYKPIENRFVLKCDDDSEQVLNYAVFCSIYKPVTSTFYANVFGPTSNIDSMKKNVALLTKAASAAGVIGGIVYTQLADDKKSKEGLEKAAEDLRIFLQRPRFKQELIARKNEISGLLRDKLGDQSANPPSETITHNIRRKRVHDARTVKLLSQVKPPEIGRAKQASQDNFTVDIVPPSIREVMETVCSPEYKYSRIVNFEDLVLNDETAKSLKEFENKYDFNDDIEMIYLIMLKRGVIDYDTTAEQLRKNELEIRKAEYLAIQAGLISE